MEVLRKGNKWELTRRVLRDTMSPSLGNLLAERIGLTEQSLTSEIRRGALSGLYDIGDTRDADYGRGRRRRARSQPSGTN
jgi:hypothetical protein